ncbi:DUF998 domain-containing protein [Enterococcus sp. LJL99]
MFFLKNYGYFFMIIAIFSELVVPVIFAHLYPNYNQGTMLISDFGEVGSPVQKYFKIWQLIDGGLFILAAPSFYAHFYSTSPTIALWIGITIVLFGIGDCIFTAIFDRVETSNFSIQGALHDYGSGVGFVALLINTFLLVMLYARQQQFLMVKIVSVIFALSSICMIFFASPRIPLVRRIDIHYRGFWQRANLFFLYLPLLIIAIKWAIA